MLKLIAFICSALVAFDASAEVISFTTRNEIENTAAYYVHIRSELSRENYWEFECSPKGIIFTRWNRDPLSTWHDAVTYKIDDNSPGTFDMTRSSTDDTISLIHALIAGRRMVARVANQSVLSDGTTTAFALEGTGKAFEKFFGQCIKKK